MIFEKLFRKKTQSAEAETELQALKEKMQQEENAKFNRRMLAGFDDNLATRKEQIRAQKIEKLFPRTMDQIAEVENGKVNREKAFAMDGMEERFFSPPKMTLDNEVLDRMTDYFIGWQSCAILKQNWLIDRACTIPAEDAIAPGWKLAFSDADQTEELSEADEKARAAKLKEIEASAKDYGIANVCKKAETLKKCSGTAWLSRRLTARICLSRSILNPSARIHTRAFRSLSRCGLCRSSTRKRGIRQARIFISRPNTLSQETRVTRFTNHGW